MSQNSKVFFAATKLPMLKKQGKITPDADGYYELVVGGLNTFNNTGAWYYTVEGCRELFGPGSLIHRRIANGCMRAEVNHPKQRPGESDESFFGRMLDIDRDNVCAHFKEIWLDEAFGKNNPQYNNPNLVAIMAKVKPSEPKGAMLKESLENPNENVCFSIRALADEGFQNGKRVRVLKEVVTIDLVNEGGILVASKWDSPATESIDNTAVETYTEEMAMRVTQDMLKRISAGETAMATESSIEAANYLAQKHFKPVATPLYANW